jgi:methyl-accepting chemotaxis protein
VASALAFVITRSITVPIQESVKVAETVAMGDLSAHIDAAGKDEPAQLQQALRRMNERLRQIVGQVRSSSDHIATGSTQIAIGNTDLSQRTEEQASNLQQTAAAMDELTGTLQSNADTAQRANQLAFAASAAASKGGEVFGQVIATMRDISASSKQIADIIGVIDGIAFQTNILALNAAVEAARAGEQGRGFAVVAGEVRSLAQRSAGAAKEIKTLIGSSVEKVGSGSRLVDDAGRSMDDIVLQVRRVSELIGEISTATAEQSKGIGQCEHGRDPARSGDPAERRAGGRECGGCRKPEAPGEPSGRDRQRLQGAGRVGLTSAGWRRVVVTTRPASCRGTAQCRSCIRTPALFRSSTTRL